MTQPKHIIHDNKVYQLSEKELYTTYQELQVPVCKPTPHWNGTKIPWDMWTEMVAWCQVTQEKFKSEALVFLFYDLETNTWSHWYPPQTTNGMTVQANEDHPQYRLQRKAFPDLQFGTLHHHCTAKAFASGTDQSDEVDRDGLHFTIGDLESKTHSVHFRFCIEGACYDLPAHGVIEMSPEVAALPEKFRYRIHAEMIQEPVDTSQWDFTDPLGNVEKKIWATFSNKIGSASVPRTGGKNITKMPQPSKLVQQLLKKEPETVLTLESLVEDALFEQGFITSQSNIKNIFTKLVKTLSKSYKTKAVKENQDDLRENTIWYCFEELDIYVSNPPTIPQINYGLKLFNELAKHERGVL